MMKLGTVISCKIENLTGGVKRRLIKYLGSGLKDVQEQPEYGPAGIDSQPIKDMVAVYAPTGESGKMAVIGYINKNQKAAAGEVRLYSQSSSGVEQFYAHLKNTGILELNGTADNLVRYRALDTALQNAITAINAENTKIATALNAIIPGIYVQQLVVLNTTPAKINEIKTT